MFTLSVTIQNAFCVFLAYVCKASSTIFQLKMFCNEEETAARHWLVKVSCFCHRLFLHSKIFIAIRWLRL